MDVFLETERLLLRRFTHDDVDNLYNLDGDPEVMRYITGGATTPREEIEHVDLPAQSVAELRLINGIALLRPQMKPSQKPIG